MEGLDVLPSYRGCSACLSDEEPGGDQEPKPRSSHHLETTGVKGTGRHRYYCTKYQPWRERPVPLLGGEAGSTSLP